MMQRNIRLHMSQLSNQKGVAGWSHISSLVVRTNPPDHHSSSAQSSRGSGKGEVTHLLEQSHTSAAKMARRSLQEKAPCSRCCRCFTPACKVGISHYGLIQTLNTQSCILSLSRLSVFSTMTSGSLFILHWLITMSTDMSEATFRALLNVAKPVIHKHRDVKANHKGLHASVHHSSPSI